MSTRIDRLNRLLPNGYPRYVRVYDRGPDGVTDRFTVVFSGRYGNRVPRKDRQYYHLAMSENPLAPNGVCLLEGTDHIIDVDEKEHRWAPGYGESNHLGTRIHWHTLPEPCIKAALHAYKELWNLYAEEARTKGTSVVAAGIAGGVRVVHRKKPARRSG